jgi:hypothetical protein
MDELITLVEPVKRTMTKKGCRNCNGVTPHKIESGNGYFRKECKVCTYSIVQVYVHPRNTMAFIDKKSLRRKELEKPQVKQIL